MARNKYPEQTVRRILEVSSRLFYEKGFEKTSIQDIVAALGMSKGAIYHHFKSKEEILESVAGQFQGEIERYSHLLADSSLTGLQKLYQFFCYALSDHKKHQRDQLFLLNIRDPQVTAMTVDNALNGAATYLAAFLEQGKKDGSMTVKRPQETAQVMLLLINVWLNPAMQQGGRERYLEKLQLMKELTAALGVPLMDERLIGLFCDYYDQLEQAGAGKEEAR
ncbi:MAG: TetR/AcrR family transcriptional regulator [Provencibacterium sp.]|nr:TetR/AcrR family transcriptional regulator [Provencibacterium sp.]